MIEARELAKRFGAVQAVRGVSFTAHDGRITGLLGPNGAGKSTTLRMLYTVLRPDAGDALIDGLSVLETPLDAARRLGVLPHSAGIYPNLSARENILYFAALQGLPAARRARTAASVRCWRWRSSPTGAPRASRRASA
jgi:sodium transport system ATP-binding protein